MNITSLRDAVKSSQPSASDSRMSEVLSVRTCGGVAAILTSELAGRCGEMIARTAERLGGPGEGISDGLWHGQTPFVARHASFTVPTLPH